MNKLNIFIVCFTLQRVICTSCNFHLKTNKWVKCKKSVNIYKHSSNHMYTGTAVVKINCSSAARVYILLTLKIADSLRSVEYLYFVRLLDRLDLCSDLRVFF